MDATLGLGVSIRAETEQRTVMKKLYIGNLPYRATETEIRELFETVGPVEAVTLVTDRATGRPRGFRFVEMEGSIAETVVGSFDGKDFGGRNLRVDFAKERREGGDSRRGPRPEGGRGVGWMR
jgi:RNA recognition motif-containing protein